MGVTDGAAELRWAPRVPRDEIRRLYASDAAGPHIQRCAPVTGAIANAGATAWPW